MKFNYWILGFAAYLCFCIGLTTATAGPGTHDAFASASFFLSGVVFFGALTALIVRVLSNSINHLLFDRLAFIGIVGMLFMTAFYGFEELSATMTVSIATQVSFVFLLVPLLSSVHTLNEKELQVQKIIIIARSI